MPAVARNYGVTVQTLMTWHAKLLREGSISHRKDHARTITESLKRIVVRYVETHPSVYLWEIQQHFIDAFDQKIGLSTLSRILKEAGWSKQRIEKRFLRMLIVHHHFFSAAVNYLYSMGLNADRFMFCDEFSIELSTCFRKMAWSRRGQTPLACRPTRSPHRFSVLILCTIDGIADYTMTNGTFDSQLFAHSVSLFAQSVCRPPGTHVLVADGAVIHKTDEAERILAESGILLRFLPPYSPKLNPCEVVIGLVRKKMEDYIHRTLSLSRGTFLEMLHLVLMSYRGYPLRNLFRHCGYDLTSFTDPYFLDDTRWSDI